MGLNKALEENNGRINNIYDHMGPDGTVQSKPIERGLRPSVEKIKSAFAKAMETTDGKPSRAR